MKFLLLLLACSVFSGCTVTPIYTDYQPVPYYTPVTVYPVYREYPTYRYDFRRDRHYFR